MSEPTIPNLSLADAPPALLTRAEAAKWLGVSERTLDYLRAKGHIPTVYLGRCARINVSDLSDYAQRCKRGSVAEEKSRQGREVAMKRYGTQSPERSAPGKRKPPLTRRV